MATSHEADRRRAPAGPPLLVGAAVLFDLDGVLVDSAAAIAALWRTWAGEQGLEPDEVLAATHGRRTIDLVRALAPDLDAEAEAARLMASEVDRAAGLVALPGAARLLASLSPGRWAVVTSGGRTLAEARLVAAGLPVPPVLVGAEDVAAGKPDPEGYRTAAARLGHPAGACVVVEDAPAGIEAGRAAGATVLAVATTHPAERLRAADAVVADLGRVVAHLEADEVRLVLDDGAA